jgi:hypothetical protein
MSRPVLAESRHESAAEGEGSLGWLTKRQGHSADEETVLTTHARSPATPRHATPRPARPAAAAARARVWHALVHFLTSQVKWNKSHHISQGKRPLDFQCGTIGILHHYTP